jgi:hypothetical protein
MLTKALDGSDSKRYEIGPGFVHRIARDAQKSFLEPPDLSRGRDCRPLVTELGRVFISAGMSGYGGEADIENQGRHVRL